MKEGNQYLQENIMQVLDNQLEAGDPPETRETYDRLIKSGITVKETRRLIACIIVGEIYDIMKNQKPFNHTRFVERLTLLPDTSWLDE